MRGGYQFDKIAECVFKITFDGLILFREMPGRKAGFLIIVLANILLAGFSILPHDHDGGYVHLHQKNCPYHSQPSNSANHDLDHRHDSHGDHRDCLLRQAYVISSESSRLVCPVTRDMNPHEDFQFFQAHRDVHQFLQSDNKASIPPPLIESGYSFQAGRIFGYGPLPPSDIYHPGNWQ